MKAFEVNYNVAKVQHVEGCFTLKLDKALRERKPPWHRHVHIFRYLLGKRRLCFWWR